jgi:hypothetical protein
MGAPRTINPHVHGMPVVHGDRIALVSNPVQIAGCARFPLCAVRVVRKMLRESVGLVTPVVRDARVMTDARIMTPPSVQSLLMAEGRTSAQALKSHQVANSAGKHAASLSEPLSGSEKTAGTPILPLTLPIGTCRASGNDGWDLSARSAEEDGEVPFRAFFSADSGRAACRVDATAID